LFDADTDPVRSSVADDDAPAEVCAAADVAFKPNCLAIKTSINEHPADAGCRPESKLGQIYDPIIELWLVYPQGTTKGGA
jgi:hypothetical protein